MRLQFGKDENEWVDLAWQWLSREVRPGATLFLPAGGTPTPFYRRWCEQPSALLKSLKLLQIDEILNGPSRGQFKNYFQAEMKPYLSQFHWIGDANEEADVAILGVGINGHVAFHEPHLPQQFNSGCVRLSVETLEYLHLEDPTWGVTYGVATFLRAKKILVLVKGERKQRIMQKAKNGAELPITWILKHPHVTVISDFEL